MGAITEQPIPQELESSTEPHKLLNETTQVPELHQKQPQATSQSLSTSPQDAGSSALIHKLLESLEALGKVQGAPVAPSILRDSGSTEDSAVDGLEHGPNSPTGVINQLDHSPTETISREHSTDCLVAAVQQLTLGAGLQGRHNQMPIPVVRTASNPQHPVSTDNWNAGGMSTGTNAVPNMPMPTNTPLLRGQIPTGYMINPNGTTSMTYPHATPQHHVVINPAAAFAFQQQMMQASQQHALPPFLAQNPNAAAAAFNMQFAQMQDPRLRHLAQQTYPEEVLVGLAGQYQSYCDQIISEELNSVTFQLLLRVKVLQLTDSPAMSQILGKRYFCSLKEVSKVVQFAKALIVAPDVRASPTAHIRPVGLLQSVLRMAQAMGVPYVFALSRRGIGQVFGRDKNMSIVAVMQTEGVEAEYVQMLELAARGRELYSVHRARRF